MFNLYSLNLKPRFPAMQVFVLIVSPKLAFPQNPLT